MIERPARRRPTPALALLAVVAVAFLVYALLAARIASPRAFTDELLYFEAAASIADGDGARVNGEPYHHSLLYPLALASVLALAPDREAAYEAAKLLNALFIALTAVPAFLLARRLVTPWWSVAVAGLAVAVPSAMYVSVTMTESLAYLTFAWALVAIVLALERPTWALQLAAIAAIAFAAGVRTQFLSLFGVYLAALAICAFLLPERHGLRAQARTLAPTLAILALGACAFILVPVVQGSTPGLLGGYGTLWSSYDVGEVGRWLVYQLANLELYLAVVPFAVAPIVLSLLYGRARDGSERHAAFFALFVSGNATLLVVVAAFNSTYWAGERLHDRPLFYVVPLWLVVLGVWLAEGLPRPLAACAVGAATALVLPLLLPFQEYAREEVESQFIAVAPTLWSVINQELFAIGLTGLGALLLFVLALVLATVLVPARFGAVFVALVASVFAVTAGLAWHGAIRLSDEREAILPPGQRSWIDDRVPPGGRVTLLTALSACSPPEPLIASYLADYFNDSVREVAHLAYEPNSLGSVDVRVSRSGRVDRSSGDPLHTEYVVAPAVVSLEGTRLAVSPTARLVLTRVPGEVRIRDEAWRADVAAARCG